MTGLEQDFPKYVADFGETFALLPAIAAISAFLLCARALRLALAWSAGLLGAIAITLLLKAGSAPVSGHTAISSAFYGGLAVIFWQTSPRPSWTLRGVALVLVSLVGLVAWFVCVLGWHSVEDSISGLVVGAVCPLAVTHARRSSPLKQPAALMLLLVTVVMVMSLHGLEFESRILVERYFGSLRQL